MASNHTLRSLHLGNNLLGPMLLEPFAVWLSAGGCALAGLSLRDNGLGPGGVRILCRGLQSNASLRSLDLWNNSAGVNGAEALADVLGGPDGDGSGKCALQHLNLGR